MADFVSSCRNRCLIKPTVLACTISVITLLFNCIDLGDSKIVA